MIDRYDCTCTQLVLCAIIIYNCACTPTGVYFPTSLTL